MELKEIKHIGVLGAGLMGHGIAQVFASAGYDVNIYDADPATLRAAKDRIAGNFNVFIELNLANPEDMDRCLDRITLCSSIEALCQGPQFIIEAILEDLKIKQTHLRRARTVRFARYHFFQQHIRHQHHRDQRRPEDQGAFPGDPFLEPSPRASLRGGDQGGLHRRGGLRNRLCPHGKSRQSARPGPQGRSGISRQPSPACHVAGGHLSSRKEHRQRRRHRQGREIRLRSPDAFHRAP